MPLLTDYQAAISADVSGYVAQAIPADEFVAAWLLDDALYTLYRADFGLSLLVLGDTDSVRRHWSTVLAEATSVGGDIVQRATVPAAAADAVGFTSQSNWNWMTSSAAPPQQPSESDVVLVSDADVINAFLDEANPDASTRPGDPEIVEWAAIPDPDDERRLLAIAAVTQWRSGARVLVSVATRPDARGRGLAGAVSAFLMRRVFEAGYSRVSLGYYAYNDTAERVYERLGFVVRSRNTSGWLVDRPPSHH